MLSLTRSFAQSVCLRSTGVLVGNVIDAKVTAVAGASLHTSAILERARIATRLRKKKINEANKKKKEERLRKNPPPLPYKLKLLLMSKGVKRGIVKPLRADETNKSFPQDDVYLKHHFCYKRSDFEYALTMVRYHYHPTLLNRPEDLLHAKVEFNMKGIKADKYLDEFKVMIPVINPFDENMRVKNVCIFTSDEDEQKRLVDTGAYLVGADDLISDIMKGRVDLAEIDHFLCHEELLVKMKPLIGLLRDKTPSKQKGTVGRDLVKLLRVFRTGVEVHVKKMTPSLFVAKQPDYGYCEAPIGRLTQAPEEIKENMDTLLSTLNEYRPKREKGGFITRVSLELLNGPHYASFSIKHPLIHDEKLAEYLKEQEKQEQKEPEPQHKESAS